MKATFKFTVQFGMRDTASILDMLRYDGARVVDWTTKDTDRARDFVVTLESERYTPERWASFGLYPKAI